MAGWISLNLHRLFSCEPSLFGQNAVGYFNQESFMTPIFQNAIRLGIPRYKLPDGETFLDQKLAAGYKFAVLVQ